MHELVTWEQELHHIMQNPEIMYGVESSVNMQLLLRFVSVEYKITNDGCAKIVQASSFMAITN